MSVFAQQSVKANAEGLKVIISCIAQLAHALASEEHGFNEDARKDFSSLHALLDPVAAGPEKAASAAAAITALQDSAEYTGALLPLLQDPAWEILVESGKGKSVAVQVAHVEILDVTPEICYPSLSWAPMKGRSVSLP